MWVPCSVAMNVRERTHDLAIAVAVGAAVGGAWEAYCRRCAQPAPVRRKRCAPSRRSGASQAGYRDVAVTVPADTAG
jgi:hypothetical protein